jgi:hypothetical protein
MRAKHDGLVCAVRTAHRADAMQRACRARSAFPIPLVRVECEVAFAERFLVNCPIAKNFTVGLH